MSRNDLLYGLILFREADRRIMARTIFWIYSEGVNSTFDLQKRTISPKNLTYFKEDNKRFRLPKENTNKEPSLLKPFKNTEKEVSIGCSNFEKIFEDYEYIQIK